MPFISWLPTATSNLVGILLPKLPAPLANRLVGNAHPALKHHFLYVAVAQGEGVVTPDAVADNFGGKAVVFVGVWGAIGYKSIILKPTPYR